MSGSQSKANEKCKNLIVMDDFNIDISLSHVKHDKLAEFCTLFNLQPVINKATYFTNNHTSIIH